MKYTDDMTTEEVVDYLQNGGVLIGGENIVKCRMVNGFLEIKNINGKRRLNSELKLELDEYNWHTVDTEEPSK